MAAKKKPTNKKKPIPATGLKARSSYLKREFDHARRRLASLRKRGSVAFDEYWEEVDRVLSHDPPLYFGGGYRTAKEYIAAELPGENERSVKRKVLVARAFTPADEARHGIAFLEEVARYVRDLTGAVDTPPAIDLGRLVILTRAKSGALRRKPARSASIVEVRAARRLFATGRTRNVPTIETSLVRAMRKRKTLAKVAVRATKAHVTFRDVPVEALAGFAAIVGKVAGAR